MSKKQRVIIAMSGGVDSSVAAAILKKQGHDVVGIFMKFWAEDSLKTDLVRENICCSADAATAARAVANKLGIPFYVVNFQKEFKKAVVDYYIKEYENGRTPNPCVVCNRDIKGEILMKKVLELEGDFLATGHYACIKKDKDSYRLLQAKDQKKDQTYFLWTLTQEKLSKMLFPVGEYAKPEIREMAKKWNLPTAERKESQGICFIPDRDISGFIKRHAKKLTKPGEVKNIAGKKLGTHSGLVNYTIGQRERLGIGGPKAYYVVKLNVDDNSLIVSDEKDLYKKKLIVSNLNWLQKKSKVTDAQIRYHHPINPCQLRELKDGNIEIIFDKPQRAVTPGQSIVFYSSRAKSRDHRSEVIGGGIIAA